MVCGFFSGLNLQNYTEIVELSRQNRFTCYSQQIPATKPKVGRHISKDFKADDILTFWLTISGVIRVKTLDNVLLPLKLPLFTSLWF